MATITESFNTANSDTLGPNLSWTEIEGDIDVISNEARTTLTTGAAARANTDLDSVNHYVQADVNASEETAEGRVGLILRKDSTATLTYYSVDVLFLANSLRILRRVGGATTLIASTSFVATAGTPVTLRGEVAGSTITATANGTQISAVDTTITTGLRTGIAGQKVTSGFVSWDNFEAGDVHGRGGASGQRMLPLMGVGF